VGTAQLGHLGAVEEDVVYREGEAGQRPPERATAAEGAFKYSRFVMIEKYNWRNLPWGGTPYVDGSLSMSGSGPSNWDFMRRSLTSYGQVMDNLLNKRYGAGANRCSNRCADKPCCYWTHFFICHSYHLLLGQGFYEPMAFYLKTYLLRIVFPL